MNLQDATEPVKDIAEDVEIPVPTLYRWRPASER